MYYKMSDGRLKNTNDFMMSLSDTLTILRQQAAGVKPITSPTDSERYVSRMAELILKKPF